MRRIPFLQPLYRCPCLFQRLHNARHVLQGLRERFTTCRETFTPGFAAGQQSNDSDFSSNAARGVVGTGKRQVRSGDTLLTVRLDEPEIHKDKTSCCRFQPLGLDYKITSGTKDTRCEPSFLCYQKIRIY